MTEDDSQKITNKKLEIESQPNFVLQDLPFELVERATNKTTKLLANSGSTQPIDGRHSAQCAIFRANARAGDENLMTRLSKCGAINGQVLGKGDQHEFGFTFDRTPEKARSPIPTNRSRAAKPRLG